MHPARSLLVVPGNRQESLDEAPARLADAVILDLAATVPDPEKARARAMVRDRLAREPGRRWWVRVNAAASGLLAADLEAAIGAGNVEGIVLPHAPFSGCSSSRG